MITDAKAALIWLVALIAVIAFASWGAHRSYRQFLKRVRGPASQALPVAGPPSALDQLLGPLEQTHSGKNGLMLLLDNADAFAARALATAQAGRSLDLMYYIWRTDLAGWLLIDALVAAADRGVRIRLLLDDVNVQGFDRTFLALSQHPLIEVRLFNPVRQRGHVVRRVAEMLLGLARFNRRMHGKLWITDGRLAILGGRNIGNTYFGADDGSRMSIDADVLMVGPKVVELSNVFDSYWNLSLSLPIVALWPQLAFDGPAFRRRLARNVSTAPSRRFLAHSLTGRVADTFLSEQLRWTDKVQLLADPPDKAYGLHSSPWISKSVSAVIAAVKSDLRLITPYFVPGDTGLAELKQALARGVGVTLLTNALVATDKVIVFGAYCHYRKPLLAAGARIYEFSKPALRGQKPEVLHAKVFIIDTRTVIIGSLNYDLRSALINTELGLMFEEPELAARMVTQFDTFCAPEQAYAVTLQAHALRWAMTRKGVLRTLAVDPQASLRRRALASIVRRLPIKTYL